MKYAAVALACVLVVGCSSATSVINPNYDFTDCRRVAVVEVTGQVGKGARNEMCNLIGAELMRKGYDVIERQQAQTILNEQKFQAGGFTTTDEAVRAGRILNVKAVIIADVPESGQKTTLSLRMVDVETGQLIYTSTGDAKTYKTESTIAGAALGVGMGAVAGHQVGRHHHARVPGTLIGAGVGGALGGVAGNALAPSERKMVQKLVKKMLDDLPTHVFMDATQ